MIADRHLRVTDHVLRFVKVPDDGNHTILRENVATLLTQMKDEFVDSLPGALDTKGIEAMNGSFSAASRIDFGLKLSRDVRQRPYTDQAVLARLGHLEQKMQETVTAILKESKGYPCQFHVAGSILRGRFGAESDLDLLVDAPESWVNQHRFDPHDDVSIQYLPAAEKDKPEMVAAFAPSVPFTAEQLQQPGLLLSLFEKGYANKGYTLENGHLKATGAITRERETPPAAAGRIGWSLPMV